MGTHFLYFAKEQKTSSLSAFVALLVLAKPNKKQHIQSFDQRRSGMAGASFFLS